MVGPENRAVGPTTETKEQPSLSLRLRPTMRTWIEASGESSRASFFIYISCVAWFFTALTGEKHPTGDNPDMRVDQSELMTSS